MSTKKSTVAGVTFGYGQVEPNHLSAQRTAQIYAQLPADASYTVLENGQYVKYDYAKGVVNKTGAGEWMLVYNEVKVYGDRETDADFAMVKENYDARVYNALGELMPENTKMVPRVFKTNIGDIYTTNCVALTIDEALKERVNGEEPVILSPNAEGYLAEGEGDMKWQVVKVYTLADGQPAVKLMRIA